MKIHNLVMLVLTLSLISTPVFADDAKVTLNTTDGSVSVFRGGKSVDIADGEQLQAGDVIKTHGHSVVDVGWDKNWGYRLLGNSECVLEKIDKKEAKIKMVDGDIIVNIENLPQNASLEVSTPTAVATVRGTQFWGSIKALGQSLMTTFAAREGIVSVFVKAVGKAFDIAAGEALDIPEGAKAGDIKVRPATKGEMNAMKQADDVNMGPKKNAGGDKDFADDLNPGTVDKLTQGKPDVDATNVHAENAGAFPDIPEGENSGDSYGG